MEEKKKRRGWPLLLLIFVGAFVLSRFNHKEETATVVAGQTEEDKKANRDKALADILKEPKVKDAAITDANVLYAQVIDDKTRRDGYAMYLCQVLNDNQAGVQRVKVVAVGSQNSANRDNAFGRLLGECWCDSYEKGGK